jgi:uracil-xanthine permease
MSTTTIDTVAPRIASGRRGKIHPVDDVLPIGKLAAYGFQHVLAFYAGAVLVPIIVAGALGLSQAQLIHLINADLFTCGIASLLQSVGIWNIGVRLPLLQGVTFTAVSPMIAIGLAAGGGTAGLLSIYGSFMVAGSFSKLVTFFPPVVTGSVILIIGIALLPVAANDIVMGRSPAAIQNPVLLGNLAYAFGTLGLIVTIQRVFHGFMATVAVLVGLVVGTLVAWLFGAAQFTEVASAGWVGYTMPFYFGVPTFSVTAIISMMIVMVITMVETTGDVYATGEIVQKRIRPDDIGRAIRADGLATLIGGVLNSFPYTCFAENVGLVRLNPGEKPLGGGGRGRHQRLESHGECAERRAIGQPDRGRENRQLPLRRAGRQRQPDRRRQAAAFRPRLTLTRLALPQCGRGAFAARRGACYPSPAPREREGPVAQRREGEGATR